MFYLLKQLYSDYKLGPSLITAVALLHHGVLAKLGILLRGQEDLPLDVVWEGRTIRGLGDRREGLRVPGTELLDLSLIFLDPGGELLDFLGVFLIFLILGHRSPPGTEPATWGRTVRSDVVFYCLKK